MSPYFVDLAESNQYQLEAARILKDAFISKGNLAWPDMKSAINEIEECIEDPNITLGLCINDQLVGWAGIRPMYDKTWELHPLVVNPKFQNSGFGKKLMFEIEAKAKEQGIIGLVLGTDDEYEGTSLSEVDISESNIFSEINDIKNLKRHPFEFYKKCGYMIVGIIPNANGIRKPDIWMWKNVSQ